MLKRIFCIMCFETQKTSKKLYGCSIFNVEHHQQRRRATLVLIVKTAAVVGLVDVVNCINAISAFVNAIVSYVRQIELLF